MLEIIKIIINWAIPLIISGIFTFLVKNAKDNKAMKASMLSLIRSQIVGKCETYIAQGYLPEYARYCLEELFKQYEVLGGNHGVKVLVNQCFELPPNPKKGEKE